MGAKTCLQGVALVLDDNGETPVFLGEERYGNGSFQRKDAVGVYDPRTVWAAAHLSANIVPHVVNEWLGQGYYCTVAGQPFVTQRSFYADSSMARLLAQIVYTRDSSQRCTQLATTTYKADGVSISARVVDQFTYNGAFPSSVVRTVSYF